MDKKLLWLDLETTGLDENSDVILEIGIVITDILLNKIDTFNCIISQPDSELNKMNDYVREMHTKSGLLKEENKISISEAELKVIEFTKKYFEKDIVLHGNSIHFDRRFIRKYFKEFEKLLKYRMIDVSTFKECLAIYSPENVSVKNNSHRSIDDIEESIKEYKKYLEFFELI